MKIVAGKYKRQNLTAPKGEAVRPTSERLRESLFDICQGFIEGARFLDIFAGTGAMGLEALSRGAKSATFIDSQRESIRCIHTNIEKLKVENQTSVLCGDAFDCLDRLQKQKKEFDIIYADPPYDFWMQKNGSKISYSQYLLQLIDKGTLLAPLGTLFIEESIEAAPVEMELNSLKLVSVRRLGRSLLQEFSKL